MITTKKIDPRPYQQKAAAAIHREWDAEEKKNRKAAKIETNNTDTATTVATQKEK